jgi:hypothetical protein
MHRLGMLVQPEPGPTRMTQPASRDLRLDRSAGLAPRLAERLARRLAEGRAMREDARAMVARRGTLAEAAAWCLARAPHLSPDERRYREGVAQRVSRMFALVGIEHRH